MRSKDFRSTELRYSQHSHLPQRSGESLIPSECEHGEMDADAVITALDLSPHPEGGYYRQTWADAASTAIYFLLRDGEQSAWHRVHDRVEVWHFYAGAPLELSYNERAPDDDAATTVQLGSNLEAAERPQAVISAGVWQRARTLGGWSLVGCTVAPPFTFDAFELAARSD
jgi:predicted cupin superfamily sugar epimerase